MSQLHHMKSCPASAHPSRVLRRAHAELDRINDRGTPQDFFDRMHKIHAFTIDVAASKDNAKCERYYTRLDSGFIKSWRDEVVWCNPPYSDLYTWTLKSAWEVGCGGCRKVVMLLPSDRTEQPWWQHFIEPFRDRPGGVSVEFVPGRLHFVRRGGETVKAPFGCVLVTFEKFESSS